MFSLYVFTFLNPSVLFDNMANLEHITAVQNT